MPKAKKEGKEKVILFSLWLWIADMQRYVIFPEVSILELSEAVIEKDLAGLPNSKTF